MECSQPVLIFQFDPNIAFVENCQLHPYTMMIPPVGQYSSKYHLIIAGKILLHVKLVDAWINIVILFEHDSDGLRLDGKSLSPVNRN